MNKRYKQPGLTVYIDNPNLFDKALNRFKRKVKNSGRMQDLKKHSYYQKPSTTRRKKNQLGKLKAFYKQKQINQKMNTSN